MTKEELSKLTPEQKRIAIAQACGWGYMRRKGNPKYNHSCVWLFPPDWKFGDRGPVGEFELCEKPEFEVTFSISNAPDYLNDLNAMAAAEAALSSGQHYTFRCRLWDITDASTDRSFVGVNGEEHNRRYCSATAARRADAFLLTV